MRIIQFPRPPLLYKKLTKWLKIVSLALFCWRQQKFISVILKNTKDFLFFFSNKSSFENPNNFFNCKTNFVLDQIFSKNVQ